LWYFEGKEFLERVFEESMQLAKVQQAMAFVD